jgi:orotidine-5'-phosphate decarboxylase
VAQASPARDRLAVPLDVPSLAAADELLRRLGGVPGWLKVGLELYTAAGPAAVEAAAKHGRVFLDLKLHDIPNTVAGAAAAATQLGVELLTLHAAGGEAMLRAAREGAERGAARAGLRRPLLVAVTVLTSLDAAALARIGVAAEPEAQALRLARLAREAGLDGVVTSALEAPRLRRELGPMARLVVPGIRPGGAGADDQVRTATPAEAIRAGADLLVVGRPITSAADPAAAARRVLEEIEGALPHDG